MLRRIQGEDFIKSDYTVAALSCDSDPGSAFGGQLENAVSACGCDGLAFFIAPFRLGFGAFGYVGDCLPERRVALVQVLALAGCLQSLYEREFFRCIFRSAPSNTGWNDYWLINAPGSIIPANDAVPNP